MYMQAYYNRYSAGLQDSFLEGIICEYERLSKLNLLPLEYRREINDLVFFFKCLKNVCKLNILDYVSFRSCTKPLRNVDHLTLDVPFSRTDVFKNSIFCSNLSSVERFTSWYKRIKYLVNFS